MLEENENFWKKDGRAKYGNQQHGAVGKEWFGRASVRREDCSEDIEEVKCWLCGCLIRENNTEFS